MTRSPLALILHALLVCIALAALYAPCIAQPGATYGPHLVATDSGALKPLAIAPRWASTATIGTDSVHVTITGILPTDMVMLAYVGQAILESTLVSILGTAVTIHHLSPAVWSAHTLTIYGVSGKTVQYLIIR